MSQAEDRSYMTRALELARLGIYSTPPNPAVGCVLVRDGRVVGEGHHRRTGGPHAEVHALEAAGEAARGATAYVNLEPCSHFGRTPPCTRALLAAGVARVVCALRDPDPRVAGSRSRRARALRRRRRERVAGIRRGRAQSRFPATHVERPALGHAQGRRESRWAHGARLRCQPLDHGRGGARGRAAAASARSRLSSPE